MYFHFSTATPLPQKIPRPLGTTLSDVEASKNDRLSLKHQHPLSILYTTFTRHVSMGEKDLRGLA